VIQVALASSSIAYFFVANGPSTAKFLTDKERACVQSRLASSIDATSNKAFTWKNVSWAFEDPKIWLYDLGFHTMSLPLYTLSLFLPTNIKGLELTAAQAQ